MAWISLTALLAHLSKSFRSRSSSSSPLSSISSGDGLLYWIFTNKNLPFLWPLGPSGSCIPIDELHPGKLPAPPSTSQFRSRWWAQLRVGLLDRGSFSVIWWPGKLQYNLTCDDEASARTPKELASFFLREKYDRLVCKTYTYSKILPWSLLTNPFNVNSCV